MFNSELAEATVRLDSAIRFRQKGGGYWYADTNIDRCAITLSGVKDFRPAKTEDEILTQLSGVAFCEFLTPPLGRNSEKAALVTAFAAQKAAYDAAPQPLSDRDYKRRAICETALEQLEYATAETLDVAGNMLKMIGTP
jgi:hypothetical protein